MTQKKAKLTPCTRWNHHKFKPSNKEVRESGEAEVEQTCIFCDQKRIYVNVELHEDEGEE